MKIGLDITAIDTKAEAERRIVARYPLWRQFNIIRKGGEALAEMSAFIDRIRAASNRLERLPRIPTDYRDERHWQ